MNKEYKKQKNGEIGARIMNKIIKKQFNTFNKKFNSLKCSNSKFNSCKILEMKNIGNYMNNFQLISSKSICIRIIYENYKDKTMN